MFRQALALLALGIVAGCANQNTESATLNSDKATAVKPTAPELAAYAGHAVYPSTQPANNDLKAAAIITDSRTALKVYNFGNEPIRDADVWVNGAFVQHIAGIAPASSVQIRTSELYNGLGKNFSSQGEPVSKVQLQMNGNLYNALGPASE